MAFLKKILPDVIVVAFFAVISFVYFYPANVEGLVLGQHDNVAGIGSGQERKEFMERTGEDTRWTNAIFSGMPTFQMAPSYGSTDILSYVEQIYRLFIPGYTWYLLVLLLGFYILLRAFDFRAWMAALGAVLWAFSSYFFILIAAGHIWKLITLAYIPATIAGMVLVYRGRMLWGTILTALFLALQIRANHVQMSYYFLFPMLFMAIAFGIEAWNKGRIGAFFKQTGVLIVAALIGISINLSNLYHTYEYSKETMRGKSELVKPDTGNQTSSGLERDYITQWSYGIGETWSLLVPNVKGGASVPLALNEKAMEKANPMYRGIYGQIGQYWGEQPGTSGPVYVGAFVLTLFILGLFIVKGPMKWALLAATILSILLSWGKNFMGFTDLFLDYVPMYDKFRAVSSILVIAEFTIPLLAMMALREIVNRVQSGDSNQKLYVKGKLSMLQCLYISVGFTAAVSLCFALMPSVFFSRYISTSEMGALAGLPAEHLTPIINNLTEMRQSIFTADAWRSFGFIVAGMLVVLLYNARKIKTGVLIALLLSLSLLDMWQINLRYLNTDDRNLFQKKAQTMAAFRKTATDEVILKDTALDYRVLNLAGNTFNENNTSYFHKSIGGYHAAKLRRYQEIIEEHIQGEMQTVFKEASQTGGDMSQANGQAYPVLNMLNARWFIMPAQGGGTLPLYNPHALGNAWFVDSVVYVSNANEEIEALHTLYPADVAVVDNKFKDLISDPQARGTITLKSYEPNHLIYEANAPKSGVVVFSEIYYPGWQATIDGEEVEIGRADYILRALNVPAGQHTIEFVFNPRSLRITETIAYIALALLGLGVLVGGVLQLRKKSHRA